MQINVTIKPSLASVGKALGDVNITTFLRDEINKMAAIIERHGKQLTPVKTGRLRASFHFSPATTFLQAVVKTGTGYDIFVHEGTKFMRARPFMKQGVEFAKKDYSADDIGKRLEEKFVKEFKTL